MQIGATAGASSRSSLSAKPEPRYVRIERENKARDFAFTPDLQDLLSIAKTGTKMSPFKKPEEAEKFFAPGADFYSATEAQTEEMRMQPYAAQQAFDKNYASGWFGRNARHRQYRREPLLSADKKGNFILSRPDVPDNNKAKAFDAIKEIIETLQSSGSDLPVSENGVISGSAEAWQNFDQLYQENKAYLQDRVEIRKERLADIQAEADKKAQQLIGSAVGLKILLPVDPTTIKDQTKKKIEALQQAANDIFANRATVAPLIETGLRHSKKKAALQKFAYLGNTLQKTAAIFQKLEAQVDDEANIGKAKVAIENFTEEAKPLLDITHRIMTLLDAKAGGGVGRNATADGSLDVKAEKTVFTSERTKNFRAAFAIDKKNIPVLRDRFDLGKLQHNIRKELNILENRIGAPLAPLRNRPKLGLALAGVAYGASALAHVGSFFTLQGSLTRKALQAVAAPAALSCAWAITPFTEALHHGAVIAVSAVLGGTAKAISTIGDGAVNAFRRGREPIQPFQGASNKIFSFTEGLLSLPGQAIQKTLTDLTDYGAAAPSKWNADIREFFSRKKEEDKEQSEDDVQSQVNTEDTPADNAEVAGDNEKQSEDDMFTGGGFSTSSGFTPSRKTKRKIGAGNRNEPQQETSPMIEKLSAFSFYAAHHIHTENCDHGMPGEGNEHEHYHHGHHHHGEDFSYAPRFSDDVFTKITYAAEKTGMSFGENTPKNVIAFAVNDDKQLQRDPRTEPANGVARNKRIKIAYGMNKLALAGRYPENAAENIKKFAVAGTLAKTVTAIRTHNAQELAQYHQPPAQEKAEVLRKIIEKIENSNLLTHHDKSQPYEKGNCSIEKTLNLLQDYRLILQEADGETPYELKLYDEYFASALNNAKRIVMSEDKVQYKRDRVRSPEQIDFLKAFPDLLGSSDPQIEAALLTHEVYSGVVNPAERLGRNIALAGGLLDTSELPKFIAAGAAVAGVSKLSGVTPEQIPGAGSMKKVYNVMTGNNPYAAPVAFAGEMTDWLTHGAEALEVSKITAGGQSNEEGQAMYRSLRNFLRLPKKNGATEPEASPQQQTASFSL